MRGHGFAVPLCCAPLLASCIFLLDYDKLEGTARSAGGAAGQSATPGGESAGGAGGATPSCGDCNDGDPCTIDTCLALPGKEPECQHATTKGLKLDGFQATLPAEQHRRVALVGSGKLSYLSVLEVNDGAPEVSLYRLAEDDAELEPLSVDLRLFGTPVSNIGLALEELAGGEVALHGFVAVKARLDDAETQVIHMRSRSAEVTSNVVGRSYRADDPAVFPQALAIGDRIVGAWIQEDGTIVAHDVSSARTDHFGDVALPATTLSLLSTDDRRPAVLFTAQAEAEAEPLGSWVEPLDGERTQLAECIAEPGTYLSSSAISTQRPGIWLANVSRTSDDYPRSSAGTLVCSGFTCLSAPNDCDQSPAPNAIRNVAGAAVHFDADSVGVIYSVMAIPQLAPKADGTGVEAKLGLVLGWTDFDAEPVETREVGSLEVAKTDASETNGFAGPDWPAVAILPGQRAVVAWIAPNPGGTGTELHVERYKMCLGER